jgi:hypothetical protein
MGGACGTYGRQNRDIQGLRKKTRWKEDFWEDLGADIRIMLKCIYKKWDGGRTWIGSSWLKIGTDGGHL